MASEKNHHECEHEELEDDGSATVLESPGSRRLFIIGPITEGLLRQLAPALYYLDSTPEDPIEIFISSGGGDVDSGIAIFGLIKQMKSYIVMTGFGTVQSMAAVIFQAADERVLEEGTRYMIHDGSVAMPMTDLNAHMTRASEMAKVNEWCNKEISKRSGISMKEIIELSRAETYYSAQEAVKFGFADRVLKPKKRYRK